MNHESTIKVIDETLTALQRFKSLDERGEIIRHEEFGRLDALNANLGHLRHKLATGELEVAVVGLEKAGKSKFSSAFVSMPGLFPSADERCTFTSTALRHGEQDMARVEFYTQKDFQDKVGGMLAEVGYPGRNIETLSLDDFRAYFASLKETHRGLYELHANKTEKDIEDIIEGYALIRPLLGQAEKTFTDLGSEELRGYITDRHVSRAVRNVTFYSTNLSGLENIVLYDVPGFDSPTQVHIKETILKLQQVDAIVMVKNIKMPSLKGNEVDILVKNSDMDGIQLSDKLFMFGSYADAVESQEALQKNRQTLAGDLQRSLRKPFDAQRMFTGCLDPAYEQQLIDRGGKTQIEELKQALRDYNARDRADILSKRIYRNVEDIKGILRGIVERTQLEDADHSEESEIVLDLLDESREQIDTAIARFINPIKREIHEQRQFTARVIEGIEAAMPTLDQAFIDDTLHQIQSADTRNVINFTKLNLELRDRMATAIKEAVITLVVNVSREDARRIEDGIRTIVLEALGVRRDHPRYEELAAAVIDFLETQTANVSIRDTAFKPLIERFIVDLIDTMILQPLGYDSRRARFMQGKADLYMLSLFSADNGLDLPYRSPLVAAVLAQKLGDDTSLELADQYREQFRRAMPLSRDEGDADALSVLTRQLVNALAEIAINRVIPLKDVQTLVKNIVQGGGETRDNVPRNVSNFLGLMREMGGAGNELGHSEQSYLDHLLRDVRQASSEEEVRQEIETDLSNLVYLFKDSVVAAMNLELPFIAAITLLTERIREVFRDRAYRAFLSQHVRDILFEDFARLDSQRARREIRATLVSGMREVLLQLEHGFGRTV